MTEISVDLSPVHQHLNALQQNLEVINNNVAMVNQSVDHVAAQQEVTKDRLEALYSEFSAFVAADIKHKAKQYAATELATVQQDIEKRFGAYDRVRKTTVGILQATDVQVVRQETMHAVGEQLMITTPGYWLAPALVALTSWIKDDRSLAERAIAEAMKRDDNRTSLCFGLICRRAARMEASTLWLRRYFQMQNPMAMDREVVVMLDGLANGVFGGGALLACSEVIEQWLAELEEQAGFLEDQRTRWSTQLDVLAPKAKESEYPTLRKYSPTAPKLLATLSAARRNQAAYDFFATLFTGELTVPPTIQAAVDSLLDSLVTNFDDEELPLQRKKRMLELIKDEDGDKETAKRRFDAENEAMQPQTNFAAILTSSAMNPAQLGATRATQRYAVSRSHQWILSAQADLVARDRAEVPTEVDFVIPSATASTGWQGRSVDGSNEQALLTDMQQQYARRTEEAVAAVKLEAPVWIGSALGVLIGLWIMTNGGAAILFGLIIAAAVGAFFYFKYQALDRIRTQTRDVLEKEHGQAAAILKASMAELADYRREVAAEDAKSETVSELLESLSSPQFVLQRPEQRVAIA